MKSFLITYDRRAGKLLAIQVFDESRRSEAMKERFAIELRERSHPDIEVVILEAASEDDLRKTHRRYFDSARDLIARVANS